MSQTGEKVPLRHRSEQPPQNGPRKYRHRAQNELHSRLYSAKNGVNAVDWRK